MRSVACLLVGTAFATKNAAPDLHTESLRDLLLAQHTLQTRRGSRVPAATMIFNRRAEKQAETKNEPRWKAQRRTRSVGKTDAKEESSPAASPLMRIINVAEGGGESFDAISSYEVSDEVQTTATDLGLLIMRLGVAAVMIHHGQEKILDAGAFTKYTMDVYFKFLPGNHLYWTYLIGLIQWLAPFGLILGAGSRLAAGSLTAVMLGAFLQGIIAAGGFEGFPFFELGGLGSKMPFMVPSYHNYGFETPLLYITIFLLLTVSGPGKFSVAERFGWNDDNSLLGKIKQ